MRLSTYFIPTMKDTPSDAVIASHKFMLRAGMIRQSSSGIYNWLPLGLRVLKKIENIIREEQNRAGAHEILMPTIQPADLWRESNRYDDYGAEMLRITDRHERDMLYGPTNEEAVTDIFRREVKSYKALPMMLYHVQWKFRDEIRPRFGVMRGREFLMKDAYSFDLDEASGVASYNRQFIAYLRSYARLGLRAIPMKADTGPIGGDLSHEFIVLADSGESEVYYERAFEDLDPMVTAPADASGLQDIVNAWTTPYAATDEIYDPATSPVDADKLITGRGVEVGHIFHFGSKYSEPMGAMVQNAEGKNVPVQMGSFGVGISRLVGAIIEASHDEDGIIWPANVAPFDVSLLNLGTKDADCTAAVDQLYTEMIDVGLEPLYDDRNERPGGKFADADLIGLPWQVAIGPRGIKSGMAEVKNRKTGEKSEISLVELVAFIRDKISKAKV